MKLLGVGKLSKNKDDLKAAVEELGGKITGTANKASLCLSTKSKQPIKSKNAWASQLPWFLFEKLTEERVLFVTCNLTFSQRKWRR